MCLYHGFTKAVPELVISANIYRTNLIMLPNQVKCRKWLILAGSANTNHKPGKKFHPIPI